MALDQQTAACIRVLYLKRKIETTPIASGGMAAYHDVMQTLSTDLSVTFPTYNSNDPHATDTALTQLMMDLETAAINLLGTVL